MRKVHFVLSALVLAAVVLQFYLAGVGVFSMPEDELFGLHTANGRFVHPRPAAAQHRGRRAGPRPDPAVRPRSGRTAGPADGDLRDRDRDHRLEPVRGRGHHHRRHGHPQLPRAQRAGDPRRHRAAGPQGVRARVPAPRGRGGGGAGAGACRDTVTTVALLGLDLILGLLAVAAVGVRRGAGRNVRAALGPGRSAGAAGPPGHGAGPGRPGLGARRRTGDRRGPARAAGRGGGDRAAGPGSAARPDRVNGRPDRAVVRGRGERGLPGPHRRGRLSRRPGRGGS